MYIIRLCCCDHSVQRQVQCNNNSYFISIVKLHVSILYIDHHQASYKTVRKR